MEIVIALTLIALVTAIAYAQLEGSTRAKPGAANPYLNLRSMRELMWLFQTHRGKSIAWLSGEKEADKELRVISQRIQLESDKLGRQVQGAGNQNWLATKKLWNKVSCNWRQLAIEDNFRLHNALVKQLMFAIEDEITLLQIQDLLFVGAKADAPCSSLLEIIEFLGQTRAIGTNVTSSGKCQSIAKIRLCYLSQQLQTSIERLRAQDPEFHQRQKLVEPVVKCVKEHLLPANDLMSSKDWFALCTKSINGLYAQFDEKLHLTKP